jgi:cytochrome P450
MKTWIEAWRDFPPLPIFVIADKLGVSEKRIQGWDAWLNRLYYKSCGHPIRWRIMFEITGQGRGARRYMRVQRQGRKEWTEEQIARLRERLNGYDG